jgi:hypothetical protein
MTSLRVNSDRGARLGSFDARRRENAAEIMADPDLSLDGQTCRTRWRADGESYVPDQTSPIIEQARRAESAVWRFEP